MHHHALADLDRREPLGVHHRAGVGTGNAEHRGHLIRVERQRELVNRGEGDFSFFHRMREKDRNAFFDHRKKTIEFRKILRNSIALYSLLIYYIIKINDRRSKDMAISYNKLWKLLIDRKMSKADLRRAAGIAPNTMTRLNRDEEVSLTVLNKICTSLSVDIGEIMEFLPESAD